MQRYCINIIKLIICFKHNIPIAYLQMLYFLQERVLEVYLKYHMKTMGSYTKHLMF